ncbi:MAG: hypothetical protein ABIJ96_13345 [Elusimicrobiota bacterium]
MKCPACGFETPDAQHWCDFCKEPFRKKEEPRAVPAQPPVKIAPELLSKLAEVKKEACSVKDAGGIPPEFAHLDTGGKIEGFSPFLRSLAYGFLAFCILLMVVVGFLAMSRERRKVRTGESAVGAAIPSGSARHVRRASD